MRGNKLIPAAVFTAAALLLSLLIPTSAVTSLQPPWLPRFLLLLAAGMVAFALFLTATQDAGRQEKPSSLELNAQQLGQSHHSLIIDEVEDYAIFMLDPAGHILSWNRGAARIKGFKRDEILGEHFSIFYPPEAVRQKQPEEMLRLAEQNRSWRTQGWRLRKDGSRFWADVLVVSLTNAEGKLIGFTKVVHDITLVQETQQQLERSQAQLAAAQGIANLGSWEWDLVENRLDWSDQLIRIYGQDPATFSPTYEHFLDSQHPEDRWKVEKTINVALEQGRDFEFQHRIVHPDGEERTLYARGKIELDEGGKPLRLVATDQDITDRKYLEESLLIQSAINESIVETLNDLGIGILIFDDRGILYSNTALDEILQIEVGKIKSPAELAAAMDLDPDSNLSRFLRYEFQPKKLLAGQTTIQGSDRLEYLEFGSELASIGHHKRTILIIRNITDRKENELRLEASREQLRRYARRQSRAIEAERARLSREIHDVLGQHFTVAKMDLARLGQRLAMSEMKSSQELMDHIQKLSQLTDTIIQTARQLATELRPTVLDDLGLTAAVEWMAREIASKSGFEVIQKSNSDFSDLDPEVATAVFRICQEALTNVAKHAKANQVQLSLQRHDEHIEVEIKDDGVGISNLDLTENSTSLGIVGMRERATAVNGKLIIAPRYSTGTVVQVVIPIEGESP